MGDTELSVLCWTSLFNDPLMFHLGFSIKGFKDPFKRHVQRGTRIHMELVHSVPPAYCCVRIILLAHSPTVAAHVALFAQKEEKGLLVAWQAFSELRELGAGRRVRVAYVQCRFPEERQTGHHVLFGNPQDRVFQMLTYMSLLIFCGHLLYGIKIDLTWKLELQPIQAIL